MSITDELREYTKKQIKWLDMTKVHYRNLFAIADRIDAEHKRQCAESWMRGHDAWNAIDRSDEMAEHGWIRLPKDADGEYVHIGDVMAYADNTKPMEVVALVPPAVFLTEDGPRYADMCRHYHDPTVEDVLREFADEMNQNLGMYTGEAIDADEWRSADNKTIAEFAAKLRLAGDAS